MHFTDKYIVLFIIKRNYMRVLLVHDIRALDKREYLMILFLFLIETIGCDPSSEPSHQDGSDEGSQHMFYTG